MTFVPFPKVPRLSRECVITEKIDGTNASIWITTAYDAPDPEKALVDFPLTDHLLYAGSRKRFITPEDDNFGFAKWVRDHADELIEGLGYGVHYGEWWGSGIQRGYGLPKGEKRFSLFNTSRWLDHNDGFSIAPECCHVVPVLFRGKFDTENVDVALHRLKYYGSKAAPGFMDPEGVMVYHTAANQMFKKTIKDDAKGKEQNT